MANLRCILVDNKKHRAWPALNRIGVDIKNDVAALISGLFAVHPEDTTTGNFGSVCKMIEVKRGEKRSDDNKLTPTERRFQNLLVAEKEELFGRVIRMVTIAKTLSVPVNYEQLEKDLRYWNDRTKTEWAASFWTPGVSIAHEEEAT
jgi:CRISPR system Cascade subunit CasB